MRRPSNDSPEQCAARMTRLLNSPGKHRKTRAYVATLPKRRAKIIVTPDEFVSRAERRRQFDVAKTAARHVIERAMQGINIAPIRKIRVRPKARTKWACRPFGHRHRDGLSLVARQLRKKDICDADRIALHLAQFGLCGLCGEPLDDNPLRGSLDHVIPIFDGGADSRGNLLLCHGECNGAKSNDVPTGCELIVLLATNARLGVLPVTW